MDRSVGLAARTGATLGPPSAGLRGRGGVSPYSNAETPGVRSVWLFGIHLKERFGSEMMVGLSYNRM